jgi:hypothetical protein
MKKTKNLAIIGLSVVAIVALVIIFTNIGIQNINSQVTDFESCAAAGYAVMESFPMQCRTPDGRVFVQQVSENGNEEVVNYFRDQLWERGVENMGGVMPIEGFDPDLYMGAFPGLEKSDFHNVDAIGGRWFYDESTDELEFVRTGPQDYITSADGTINDEGMPTLLNNIASRLGVSAETKADVDNIINMITE